MRLTDLEHLPRAKRVTIFGLPGIRACCPAHEDTNPSFYAWEGDDGWIHVKCSKCAEGAIMGALGWSMEDRRYLNGEATISPLEDAIYVYTNETNAPIFRKRRYYKDRKKSFIIERLEGGKYVSGLLPAQKDLHLLYNLPGVIAAVRGKQTVYVCEGEKACDAMIVRGFAATCQPYGADCSSGTKWRESHTRRLSGADVMIIADRDDVGVTYARSVYFSLKGHARSVALVQSATQGEKDDAFDHFASGLGVEQFVTLAAHPTGAAPYAMVASWTTLDQVEEEAAEWLMWPYIARSSLTLLQGDPGSGKSRMTRAIISTLTSGGILPNGVKCEHSNVILLSCEDSASKVLVKSFRQLGADLSRISIIEVHDDDISSAAAALDSLEDRIKQVGAALVVIDPIVEYIGSQCDINQSNQVREFMARLRRIAERYNISVVLVHHMNKSTTSKPLYRAVGSIDFIAACRNVLMVGRDPDDVEIRGVAHIKQNWGPEGKTLGFTIDDDGKFEWDGESDLSADRMSEVKLPSGHAVNPTKRMECQSWLREILVDTGCPLPVADVIRDGKIMGFSRATVFRARKELSAFLGSEESNSETRWFALAQPRVYRGGD